MHEQLLAMTMLMHVVHGTLSRRSTARTDPRTESAADARTDRGIDRGAVSIEQVLWYAAAAVSVAVVAAIIWSQIRTTASTPVQQPSAP
jgi:hypothetical protein